MADSVTSLLLELTELHIEYALTATGVHLRSLNGEHIPLSLKLRACQLRDDLAAFEAFAAQLDDSLLGFSARIARERPAGFPVAGHAWDTADDLLFTAACERDAETAADVLCNREARAREQMAAYRRLHDDSDDEGDSAP